MFFRIALGFSVCFIAIAASANISSTPTLPLCGTVEIGEKTSAIILLSRGEATMLTDEQGTRSLVFCGAAGEKFDGAIEGLEYKEIKLEAGNCQLMPTHSSLTRISCQ